MVSLLEPSVRPELTYATSAPQSGGGGGEAHSMSDSAQVTAPGAVTSMIVAVSSRANRQNRSTCSRMSVPLVQNPMLRLVDRFGRRDRCSQIAARPRQDRLDGHRHRKNHPEDKCESSSFWFRCHVAPPGPKSMSLCRTLEERIGRDV